MSHVNVPHRFRLAATRRTSILGSLALSVLGILPFLIAFLFIRPSYDDAAFYLETKTRGTFGAAVFWYRVFSGRYTSNAIVSLLSLSIPFLWLYRICCLLIFVAFVAGVYRAIRVVLGIARPDATGLAGLVVSTFLTMTPSAPEALYWLTGAATYTLGTAFLLFAIASVQSARATQRGTPAAIAWIVLAVGMNEVALLMLNGFLAYVVMRELIDRRHASRRSIVLMAACLIASLAAVLAPGNFTRLEFAQSLATTSTSLTAAFLTAAKATVLDSYYLVHASPLLGLLLLAVSLDAREREPTRRRITDVLALPWFAVVILIVIAFFAYAQGFHPIPRVMNPVYFAMILFAAITVVRASEITLIRPVFSTLVVVLAFLTFASGMLRSGSGVRTAYAELFRGEWERYDRELAARDAFIEQRRGQHVRVSRLGTRPKTLFVFDIGVDPTQRHNAIYAYFHGVKSLAIAAEP
jgi:hypothetical protein